MDHFHDTADCHLKLTTMSYLAKGRPCCPKLASVMHLLS